MLNLSTNKGEMNMMFEFENCDFCKPEDKHCEYCEKGEEPLSDVSEPQLKKMKHALGMNYKSKPYRNYYNCSADNKDWNDLVQKGYAIKGRAWTEDTANFYLTYEAVKLVYGKPISKKYYDGL